ncbi:hypothetical protein [Kribbella italica]|uniref:DUF3168 domain-containing protein n=1 Tax=Kribbella italica TaxID=1540520 RepID=A0A7W9MWD5_9ACTN|nr:hypothetical protein [Kribbella italica]MBB5838709.1 hypothetical protein [Kribbella italica]
MALSATRTAIAAALSAVDGVTGYVARPTVWGSGDAVVFLDRLEKVEGVITQATWRIVLLLSGDEGVAIDQLDTLFDPIIEATRSEIFIDSASPELIPSEGGPMTAIVFLARSE